jgi:hypothetical protein
MSILSKKNQSKIGFKYTMTLLLLLLATNFLLGQEIQIEQSNILKSFPEKYIGKYLNSNDSTLLEINKNSIKISKNLLAQDDFETLFVISDTNILRYIDNCLYLNSKTKKDKWGTEVIALKDNRIYNEKFIWSTELIALNKIYGFKELEWIVEEGFTGEILDSKVKHIRNQLANDLRMTDFKKIE